MNGYSKYVSWVMVGIALLGQGAYIVRWQALTDAQVAANTKTIDALRDAIYTKKDADREFASVSATLMELKASIAALSAKVDQQPPMWFQQNLRDMRDRLRTLEADYGNKTPR